MHYGILKQLRYGNESKPWGFILIGSLKDKRGRVCGRSPVDRIPLDAAQHDSAASRHIEAKNKPLWRLVAA